MPSVVVVNQPSVSIFSGSTQIGTYGNPIVFTGSANADVRIGGSLISQANRLPVTGALEADVRVASALVSDSNRLPVTGALNSDIRVAGSLVSSTNPVPVSIGVVSSLSRLFILPCVSGTARDLLVDGSTSQKVFQLTSSADFDRYINEIRFVANAADIQFNGAAFMKVNTTLVSGVLLQVQANATSSDVYTFKQSEDFLVFGNTQILDQTDTSDLLACSLDLGGSVILRSGSSDFVKVTVRDNLINAGNIYFACFVRGYEK